MERRIQDFLSNTLRGGVTARDLEHPGVFLLSVIIICVSLFPYGFTIGVWRDPLQGLFAGLKFPLVVLLTGTANGVLNGMLGKFYGADFTLAQTVRSITASFVIAGLLLASLSPVFLFLALTAPPLGSEGSDAAYSLILLGHVAAIAVAGVMATVRLYGLVRTATKDSRAARRVLAAWIFMNMIVGCQLSWNLRPFIGSPDLPLQFFRPNAFQGNFYEAVWSEANNSFL